MPPLPVSTYVSLTTFRRTGAAVAIPVWAHPTTAHSSSGRGRTQVLVKCLRHTPRVTVAPCDFRGQVHGAAVGGAAVFVDRADWSGALAALRRAYGVRFQLGHLASRPWHRLTRRGAERHEIIRIRPA